jgi:hypothetical protein
MLFQYLKNFQITSKCLLKLNALFSTFKLKIEIKFPANHYRKISKFHTSSLHPVQNTVTSSASFLKVVVEASLVCISPVPILCRLQFLLCPRPPTSDPVKSGWCWTARWDLLFLSIPFQWTGRLFLLQFRSMRWYWYWFCRSRL